MKTMATKVFRSHVSETNARAKIEMQAKRQIDKLTDIHTDRTDIQTDRTDI